jgi:hypothetical protein
MQDEAHAEEIVMTFLTNFLMILRKGRFSCPIILCTGKIMLKINDSGRKQSKYKELKIK